MKPTIGIIDYGIGNIFSVQNALNGLDCRLVVAADPEMLKGVDKLILPGVGAFPDGMKKLNHLGFIEYLNEFVGSGNYLLGICLGMQLLLSEGKEGTETKGLGLIKGSVESLIAASGCRIPHIGWNDVYSYDKKSIELFDDVEVGSSFYFVHSYHVKPSEDLKLVYTNYCNQNIVAAYQKDNLFGVQFHPEKSQKAGLKLLRNFIELRA